MPPRRSLPPDAELAVKGHVEPVLINGGQTIKSLSAVFLADLGRHWRVHGPKVLDVLAEKYPQAYSAVAHDRERARDRPAYQGRGARLRAQAIGRGHDRALSTNAPRQRIGELVADELGAAERRLAKAFNKSEPSGEVIDLPQLPLVRKRRG
jgi:hypothetical protein